MMFVGAGTVQNLAYQTQDIDCRDHDGRASDDCEYPVEGVRRSWNAPTNMVISATNPLNPGRPREARPAIT